MLTREFARKKPLLQPTEAEVSKSNQRYDRLYALTLEISGMNALPALYWRDDTKWCAFACAWKNLCVELQCEDIFYAVLNHIHWGVYPTNDKIDNWNLHHDDSKSALMQEFLGLVEEEMLSPGQATYEWHRWEPFKTAFWSVSESKISPTNNGPRSLSKVHHRYLHTKTNYKLHSLGPNRKIWSYYKHYEEVVHLLLPEAVNWNTRQWSDEDYIFDKIKTYYHVDYSTAPEDFSFLVGGWLMDKFDFDLPEVANSTELIRAIEILPYSMAVALWPENTKGLVIGWYLNAFHIASRYQKRKATHEKSSTNIAPNSLYDYRYLKVSWLQKVMLDWVTDGTITDPKIRKMVFDVETQS